ncbi:MAG: MurR/RpiR family transcriptional regulator [Spirochaetales bacterium]|nr:MurR/RpiR family transcriptional regulator [Spirochaetales bacterium]
MLLLRIRGLLPSLNPALQRIGQYILDHPNEVKLMRIKELAARCGVAEATISRFVKTVGLGSFQELKISLAAIAADSERLTKMVYEEVTKRDPVSTILDKIFAINSRALEDTRNILDAAAVERAVAAVDRARHVDIYAAGGSFVAAEHARLRFYRIGKRCQTYSDPNQQSVSASLLGPGDLAVGISNSGRTVSTVSALRRARGGGAGTICITSFDNTPLIEHADIVLFTSTQDSAFFQESMVSRLAQMLVIDVLYACLAVRHFETSVGRLERSAEALRKMFL